MSLELWAAPSELATGVDICAHSLERTTVADRDSRQAFVEPESQSVPESTAGGAISSNLAPGPDLTWSDKGLKLVIKLQVDGYSQGHPDSLESFLARLSGSADAIDASGLTLKPSLQPRSLPTGDPHTTESRGGAPAPDAPLVDGEAPAGSSGQGVLPSQLLVFRAAPAGCRVSGGSICLAEGEVLLLEGEGAAFKGTSFSGGAVICAGADCAVTFHDCSFTDCTLNAVHGATVTARITAFTSSAQAVVACGSAAFATLSRCTFRHCRAAAAAEQGAALTLEECIVSGTALAAAARGADTRVALTKCTLEGTVCVSEGASGIVSACDVTLSEGATAGVRVMHGAVSATACEILGMHVTAAHASSEQQHEKKAGLVTTGVGYQCVRGTLEVSGGSVRACGVGVRVVASEDDKCGGGGVKLHGVELEAYERGVVVEAGCEADAVKCLFWGDAPPEDGGANAGAVVASAGVAEEPREAGSKGQVQRLQQAVVLLEAKKGTLRECEFEWNDVDVSAESTEGVGVFHCKFAGTKDGGTCVAVTGRADIEDCSFFNATAGIAVRGELCSVRRCEVGPNVGTGVMAADGSRANVLNSKFNGCSVGLTAGTDSQLAVQDCEISGTPVGLDASGGGFKVTGKRVHGCCGTAVVRLTGAGEKLATGRFEWCEFRQSGKGVWVRGYNAKVVVKECGFKSCGVGMHAEGATRAVLHEECASMSTCTRGIVSGQLPEDMRQKCGVCGLEGEDALARAWHALHAARGRSVEGARCPHEGALAHVKVSFVEVADSLQEAVYVTAYGRADVDLASCEYCGIGVKEEFIAGRSRLVGTALACGSDCNVFGAQAFRLLGPDEGFEMVPERLNGVTVIEPMMRQDGPEHFL